MNNNKLENSTLKDYHMFAIQNVFNKHTMSLSKCNFSFKHIDVGRLLKIDPNFKKIVGDDKISWGVRYIKFIEDSLGVKLPANFAKIIDEAIENARPIVVVEKNHENLSSGKYPRMFDTPSVSSNNEDNYSLRIAIDVSDYANSTLRWDFWEDDTDNDS